MAAGMKLSLGENTPASRGLERRSGRRCTSKQKKQNKPKTTEREYLGKSEKDVKREEGRQRV